MDLYAPVTNALANTQRTIVDLMKVFMSNEIAKQTMELEREKLGQTSRGLDLEADRNRQAAIKEQSLEDRERQAREDRLRARGEDVAFRTAESERAATHRSNVFGQEKLRTDLAYDTLAADKEHRGAVLGIQGRTAAVAERGATAQEETGRLDKSKFEAQFGPTTVGKLGEQMGIDPFVWGYLNINKDAQTTPDRFQKMMANPQMLAALPRAAIVRHAEQLKTIEQQILTEKDPARKEQMKKNYDNLYGQIRIIQDTIEKGPPKEVLTSVLKGMGITDPDEAAAAMQTITEKWKTIRQPPGLDSPRPSAKFDKADPAATQEITAMLQEIKAGKYDLTPAQMHIIQKMTSNVTPQNTASKQKALAAMLATLPKRTPPPPLVKPDEESLRRDTTWSY